MAGSPSFSINGGAVNEKVSVAAGDPVVATLDSIDGVRQVTWSISRTDELSTPGDYALVPSGSVGQIVSTTALGTGRSAVLKAVINGGLDPVTERPSDATIQEVKFFVPGLDGFEALCGGETDSSFEKPDRVASPTHGAVDPLNRNVRQIAAQAGAAVGGAFGRQTTGLGTWQDVGAIIVNLSETPSLNRVLEFIALLSTDSAASAAQARLFNLSTSQPVTLTGGPASSVSLTPEKITLPVVVDANFLDTAEQILMVQIQSVGGTDNAFLDFGQFKIRFTP